MEAIVIEPSQEERDVFIERITAVIGGQYPEFIETLSYFPDVAENFLSTQEYAHGREVVYRNRQELDTTEAQRLHVGVWHRRWAIGLDGKTVYKTSNIEDFRGEHYLGEDLLPLLKAIRYLREYTSGEFTLNDEVVNDIVANYRVQDKDLAFNGKMKKKLFEVMELSAREVSVFHALLEASREDAATREWIHDQQTKIRDAWAKHRTAQAEILMDYIAETD